MSRFLFGCLAALCVSFSVGCGGGSTETTVVEPSGEMTAEEVAAADEAYEAEMAEASDIGDE